MSKRNELDVRMKTYYEEVPKIKLMRRVPVIIRIDGKSFHTFTKGFMRPFDEVLITSMQETTKYLCENIQGCVLGYCQSDEISLILVDYQTLHTAAWFDYEVQKMCSVAASMATMAFNKFLHKNISSWMADNDVSPIGYHNEKLNSELKNLNKSYWASYHKGAMFDARCFNIPKEEVTNYIYWRQLDASRNSIQMVGQAYFSQNELHKKKVNEIQDMLMLQKGINWNNFPTHQKRGSCVIKSESYGEPNYLGDYVVGKPRWIIDKEIPIFKNADREYIDNLVFVGE